METFEKMKKSAFVINTSRGGLIKQDDLIEALKVLNMDFKHSKLGNSANVSIW